MLPGTVSKDITFQDLKKLRRLLSSILPAEARSLEPFYMNSSGWFSSDLQSLNRSHPSKGTTANCATSMLTTGSWARGPWSGTEKSIAGKMLTGEWESAGLPANNVFTVSLLLEAVTALMEEAPDAFELSDEEYASKLIEAQRTLLNHLERGYAQIKSEMPSSAYLTHLAVRALRRQPEDFQENQEVKEVYKRTLKWSWTELHRQLALVFARSRTQDISELGYCIILIHQLSAPGTFTPEQLHLLDFALESFFAHQLDDGTWPESRPVFFLHNQGARYAFDYELLSQMLLTHNLRDSLLPYIANLIQSAHALSQLSFDLSDGRFGWASGNYEQKEGPEAWTTALGFQFIFLLDRLAVSAIRRMTFDHVGMPWPAIEPHDRTEGYIEKFLDCPLPATPNRTLRSVIFKDIADPIALQSNRLETGSSIDDDVVMSAVLFGPPGTSKTELSRMIAGYLGWPLLEIDISYFMRHGIDNVQSEAAVLFEMLTHCERMVVLLDEFDEMVTSRHSGAETFSRFLTTAMLPKLAAVNKSRRILLLVATNYIDRLDDAAVRYGRFDALLQVLPPTYEEKLRKWPILHEKFGRSTDACVGKRLSALTFAETAALSRLLTNCNSQEEAQKLLEHSYQSCTLNLETPTGTKPEDPKRSWGELNLQQQARTRLPTKSS